MQTKRTRQMEAIARNMKNRRNSKIMLFFHGNAEDIGIAKRTLNGLRARLKVSTDESRFYVFSLDFHFRGRILRIWAFRRWKERWQDIGWLPLDLRLLNERIGCSLRRHHPFWTILRVQSLLLHSPTETKGRLLNSDVSFQVSQRGRKRPRRKDLILPPCWKVQKRRPHKRVKVSCSYRARQRWHNDRGFAFNCFERSMWIFHLQACYPRKNGPQHIQFLRGPHPTHQGLLEGE